MTVIMGEVGMKLREYFDSAQGNANGHRKLVHSLYRLHNEIANEIGLTGEEEFFLSLVHCLNILLAVKKSEDVVTRSMRFLMAFIVYSAEKDESGLLTGSSPTTRLIENLMIYILEGIDSKARLVRVRLAQLMVACVNAMEELSEGVWEVFRAKMTERLFDKEAAVRIQIIHSMSRLQALPLNEEGSLTVRDIFIELLCHDPVAEVRKCVLEHVEVDVSTLEAILSRRRDVDARVRRCLFGVKMREVDVRILSIQQRDNLLRSGLRDRDASVRAAAMEMVFSTWIASTNHNLVQLLFSLDVQRHEDVAENALRAFYEQYPDMFKSGFPPQSFLHLTPETAIAMRVYCESVGRDTSERETELLPEMTSLANTLARLYEEAFLLSDSTGADPNALSGLDKRLDSEFIMSQILKLVRLLDTSDEMGRRVMQTTLIDILANLEVSEYLFNEILNTLSFLTPEAQGFLHLIGSLLADLHSLVSGSRGEGEGDDSSSALQRSLESLSIDNSLQQNSHSALSEDIIILANLRCLSLISQYFKLTSSASSNEEEAVMMGLLNDAVVPAINSSFAAVQAAGLKCLGLACLLRPPLAKEYLSLLIAFYQQSVDEVQHVSLQIIFDLLLTQSKYMEDIKSVILSIIDCIDSEDAECKVIGVEGFAKLLLHRVIEPIEEVTVKMINLYFDPSTCAASSDPRPCQTLTYAIQAFAYSNAKHQNHIASIVPTLIREVSPSCSLLTVGMQLIQLTDYTKLLKPDNESVDEVAPPAHYLLAEQFAWLALESSTSASSKPLFQLFTKVPLDTLPPHPASLKRLLILVGHLIRSSTATTDKTLQNSLKRIVNILVERDDPTEVLDADELAVIKERLNALGLGQAKPSVTTAVGGGRRKRDNVLLEESVNIMNEISEIL